MALTTYAGLKTALADWLERGDATAVIPDFIVLAEARMKRLLRTQDIIVRAFADVDEEFSDVPGDFIAPRSMRLSEGTRAVMQFLTPDQMLNVGQSLPSGPLQYYALIGNQFQYAPDPTNMDLQTVEHTYFAKFNSLSDTQTSNWILAKHPDVYLNGSLLEAGLYYRDNDLISSHEALFTAAIDEINRTARRDEMGPLTPSPSSFTV